ncbi:c-type cytochrome biogenesis protein CcmI [Ovoidimarina sediminis]|uniref:c-type cytochrome biogenesis protein CcmI n=1 Tax=Ovoidimarina sediminis TaxID=3079856 RepID=UPI00291310D4|nr:c-type cytochrome biogenesis protein CcmI [Rhodophyticola sp. MJ-SS7]MDU8946738.1 c-type cytochrome biogenesis protein CcmI [Rhodophyticola sp. MJ-SS7]
MIWLVMTALVLFAATWVGLPFLRGRVIETNAGDAAISIYADQIDEVERDRAQGLISSKDAQAAVTEIEHRRTRVARDMPGGFAVSQRTPAAALVLGAGLAAASLGGYALYGQPAAPDMPLLARKQDVLEQRAAAGDITSRIQLLIQQTEEAPQDFESWWMLARSYAAVGDTANSAEAYRQAVLLNDAPGVQSAYAEAMTIANGNKVPEGAEIIFAQVAREVNDPRALYYLALARAQRQDFEGALQDWAALAAASESDAPWMPLIRRDIGNMVRFLQLEITDYLPDATPQEIALASGAPETAPADIRDLRTALTEDPMDHAGWIALAEAEAAAGRPDAAAEAIAEGRRHFRGAPFVLEKLAEAERALGLDLVAEPARGPDAEDIAAAATMTEADRAAMIEGMVAGLAARLEENPDDPDGWAMLIRSYRTLGDAAKASEAENRVRELYDGQPELTAIFGAL